VRKKPIIGTIVGVFYGALDGVQAQLIRITQLGYTVELLESKDLFRKGDRVHVSVTEFTINKEKIDYTISINPLCNGINGKHKALKEQRTNAE
jgi:hypothetical protein